MIFTQKPTTTNLATRLSYIPESAQIEICFGGVNPYRLRDGERTTCYGIYIPATEENPSVGIIVDNGTGIRNVVNFMRDRGHKIMIQLQTHIHFDHVMAARHNNFLRDGTIDHNLTPPYDLKEIMRLFSRRLYPVDFELEPVEEWGDSFEKHGMKIEKMYLPHGLDRSTGFKITALGKVIIVATDCELNTDEHRKRFNDWSENADLIIIDMQDNDVFYRPGYGHNCPELIGDLLSVRENSKPMRVALVHRESRSAIENTWDLMQIVGELNQAKKHLVSLFVPDNNDVVKI